MLLIFSDAGGGGGPVGNTKAFEDLTTAYNAHLVAVRATDGSRDLTALAVVDLNTMRAASVDNLDDLNSAIAEYIYTNG